MTLSSPSPSPVILVWYCSWWPVKRSSGRVVVKGVDAVTWIYQSGNGALKTVKIYCERMIDDGFAHASRHREEYL
jgi:hypothetical protein